MGPAEKRRCDPSTRGGSIDQPRSIPLNGGGILGIQAMTTMTGTRCRPSVVHSLAIEKAQPEQGGVTRVHAA